MIKAGNVIFVKNNNWLTTKLITFFDTGRFSHVCIATSDTHVIEAQYGTKARIVPFYYGQDEYVVIDLNLSEEETKRVVNIALSMTGKWYDYPQLLGYAIKKIFGLKSKNLLNNPNNWICSELVYNMLVSLGKISPTETLNDLTPNQLYNFLNNLCKSQDANCHEYDNKIQTPTEIKPQNPS
jgi:hypothetical protein